MVDICFSHSLEDCPQNQVQEKYLYLELHASKALSSALSAEIEDMIKMEYGLLESINLLWKALEQMFGSSNDKRSSSTNIPENVSSSSRHIDQDQEEQSRIQKEKVKLDGPIFQTGVSGFGRIEAGLHEEVDCSPSSFDDDDDDTNNEDDDQELLMEFQKLISKHMKLQKRYGDLLCSHEKLIDSYGLLEATHEVIVITVKFSQPHTCTCAPQSIDLSCANSCCSHAKPSCDEHALVETCDSVIASENDELKRD
jgi:hypothetical protein